MNKTLSKSYIIPPLDLTLDYIELYYCLLDKGASGSEMVSKLDFQNYKSGFESHWVPHSYGP